MYSFGCCQRAGVYDIFVLKINSNGEQLWNQELGTKWHERGFDVTTDSKGNVYVTGETNWGLDGNKMLGQYDAFLIKYNSDGVKQWTKQFGSDSNDYGYALAVDSNDFIYVTGQSDDEFDGLNDTSSNGSAQTSDIFLIKFNQNGEKYGVSWNIHNLIIKQLKAIAIDDSNNVYVGGSIKNSSSSPYQDYILIKYNSSGDKLWQQIGGVKNDHDLGLGLEIDSKNNVYFTGYTGSSLDGNTHQGSWDTFIVIQHLRRKKCGRDNLARQGLTMEET